MRWEGNCTSRTTSRCSRDIAASSTLPTSQPYGMRSNIRTRLHCTDTTSGRQCSNGKNRRARTSTRHHSSPSKQSRTLSASNLTQVRPCQPTHWHNREFQSSRATQKQHTRLNKLRTMRRQDAQRPIPRNSMKSGTAKRLHQAHHQITTSNCT